MTPMIPGIAREVCVPARGFESLPLRKSSVTYLQVSELAIGDRDGGRRQRGKARAAQEASSISSKVSAI
jgi:hypothetical protein